jgi:glycosyltransferase involved in cell wall biosynthesis
MPVYKEPEEWLRKSVESILRQTYSDFEFIIINDAHSNERQKAILLEYQAQDSRIIIQNNNENLGVTKSLNKGLSIARGNYIARMDADDAALPERLAQQYEFLEKNEDVFLVGCSVRIMDDNSRLKEKVIKESRHDRIVKNILKGKLGFYHSAIMFRNEGFTYRDNFETTQDYDFYLNLLSAGKRFASIKEVLLYYRMSDKSISGNKRRQQIILKALALRFYEERKEKGSDSYDKLDFSDEPSLLKYLGVNGKNLETTALKQEIAFALGAGNYSRATDLLPKYIKSAPASFEKTAIALFVKCPLLHRIYRKIRSALLRV